MTTTVIENSAMDGTIRKVVAHPRKPLEGPRTLPAIQREAIAGEKIAPDLYSTILRCDLEVER